MAVHIVVHDGTLNYVTKLVDFWPEFCSQTGDGALISEGQTQDDEDGGVPFRLQQLAWKRSITVKDVLNHTAGLAGYALVLSLTRFTFVCTFPRSFLSLSLC